MLDSTLATIFLFVAFCVYMDYRVKALKARSNSTDAELLAENAELREKTDALEERVRVLESIVTDRRFRLDQEIETLKSA